MITHQDIQRAKEAARREIQARQAMAQPDGLEHWARTVAVLRDVVPDWPQMIFDLAERVEESEKALARG